MLFRSEGKTLEQVYLILRIPFSQLNAVSMAYKYVKTQVNREKLDNMIEEEYGLVRTQDITPFD